MEKETVMQTDLAEKNANREDIIEINIKLKVTPLIRSVLLGAATVLCLLLVWYLYAYSSLGISLVSGLVLPLTLVFIMLLNKFLGTAFTQTTPRKILIALAANLALAGFGAYQVLLKCVIVDDIVIRAIVNTAIIHMGVTAVYAVGVLLYAKRKKAK